MFTHTDWSLTISVDIEAEELIFQTIIGPNKWLGIGLAKNLLNADVIQWVSGAEGANMQKESYASDKIAVNGVLLPNLQDHLRVGIDVNTE